VRRSANNGARPMWEVAGVDDFRFSELEVEFAAQAALVPRPDAFRVRWIGRYKPTWESVHRLGGYYDWPLRDFMLTHANRIRQQADAIHAENERKRNEVANAAAAAAAAADNVQQGNIGASIPPAPPSVAAQQPAQQSLSARDAASSSSGAVQRKRKRKRRTSPHPSAYITAGGTIRGQGAAAAAAAVAVSESVAAASGAVSSFIAGATEALSRQPTQQLLRVHSAPCVAYGD
jgi:hypothetical protein